MSTWILERRFPKVFGSTARLELSADDGLAVPVPVGDRRDQLLEMLTRLRGLPVGAAPTEEPVDAALIDLDAEHFEFQKLFAGDSVSAGEPPQPRQ